MKYYIGIDIGSTTAKIVLRKGEEVLFERYERHFSQVREKTAELLRLISGITGDSEIAAAISGSAGLGLAEAADIPFDVLQKVMSRIINEVKGVNRCFYDITSKPPGTVEFE